MSNCFCFFDINFSLLTRESIGKEAELEMKLAIVSNALMKVQYSPLQRLLLIFALAPILPPLLFLEDGILFCVNIRYECRLRDK